MTQFHFGELVRDPDFSRVYEVHKKNYTWDGPRINVTSTTIKQRGIIELASEELLEEIGFNIDDGSVLFYTWVRLITATDDTVGDLENPEQVASEIVFEGILYRLMRVKDYRRFGFYIYQCKRDRGL